MCAYVHKSGFQKRKERKERKEREAKGLQPIIQFLKSAESDECPKAKEGDELAIASTNKSDTTADLQSDKHDPGSSSVVTVDLDIDSVFQLQSSEEAAVDIVSESIQDQAQTQQVDLADVGLWPDHITDNLRQNIVSLGVPKAEVMLQIIKMIPKDMKGNSFSDMFLYSSSANNREKHYRDWLVWSKEKKAMFCFPCLLFSTEKNLSHRSLLARKEGFSPYVQKWKKLYVRLPEHENSVVHKISYCKWKELDLSLGGHGVDHELQKQIMNETEEWRAILMRLLDVTLHCASRGLPFQGDNNVIGDPRNGNFLGILELLGKYDRITHEHLAKVKKAQTEGKTMQGQAHYLSWQSQNEFIELCAKKVLSSILDERQQAIYYSIIVDSTPDVAHLEQNVLILRFLTKDDHSDMFEIHERFIEFIMFHKKTGEEIGDMVLSRLDHYKIPFSDCRGQGYDNGSNMSGKVKGVQARLHKKNNLAEFSPCGAHTLNLTGVHAAALCPETVTFFGCVQRLYVFFSGSPARWKILKEEIPSSLHSQSDTRWSARVDAVRPVSTHLPGILTALDKSLDNSCMTHEMRAEVRSLKLYFTSYSAIVLAAFWFKVLSSIDLRNKIIQSRGISLESEMSLISDLCAELRQLRDKWADILSEAHHVATSMGIMPRFPGKRGKKRKRFHDEALDEGVEMTKESDEESDFRINVFYCTLDYIVTDMDQRFKAVKGICDTFKAILKYVSLSETELEDASKCLVQKYSLDLSCNFVSEMLHLKKIFRSTFHSEQELTPLNLLNEIYCKKLQPVFSEICIALRIFCTLPVTVAEAERSFSKLSNIKTFKRATMGQERLSHLALLSIENKLARSVDYTSVISDFARKKARKAKLI